MMTMTYFPIFNSQSTVQYIHIHIIHIHVHIYTLLSNQI